jgi:hypothetical protein
VRRRERVVDPGAAVERAARSATPRNLDTAVADIVRTDQLRDRIDILDKCADYAPFPVAERLRANATKLLDCADAHDRTRLTLKDTGENSVLDREEIHTSVCWRSAKFTERHHVDPTSRCYPAFGPNRRSGTS